MPLDIQYIKDTLSRLVSIPSPTGCTHAVMKFIEEEFKSFEASVTYSRKGGLLVQVNGENPEQTRVFSAHADTLGAMVTEIKSNGRIGFTEVGGVWGNSIECENCTIETTAGYIFSGVIYTTKPSPHIFEDYKTLERKLSNMELVLDEKVFTAEDVKKLGIQPGDFIRFDPRFTVTPSCFIKSRFLDDKASVAVLLGAARVIREEKIVPHFTTCFYISNFEEVGHGAASSLPLNTAELIAVDMGTPGTGQNSDEYSVCICAKDSGGPYHYELRKELIKTCETHQIPYKVDIYPHYGSDAGAALRAGHDIRFGLIGPGVYASHSYERTHQDALLNTGKLILEYIQHG